MQFTRDEIRKLNDEQFRDLAAKIDNKTKWKCLEARALFYQRLANSQKTVVHRNRR